MTAINFKAEKTAAKWVRFGAFNDHIRARRKRSNLKVSGGQHVKIATFNLESFGSEAEEGLGIEERVRILRPQLVRLEADILCLQEVNGQHRKGSPDRKLDALDTLLEGTAYASYHRAATSGPHGTGVADVHNLVTLSRWPIERHEELRHARIAPLTYRYRCAIPPADEEVEIRFDRPLLVTSIRYAGQCPLTVINVHLRAPLAAPVPGQKESPFVWKSVSGWAEGFYLSVLKRAGQALELRLTLEDLFNDNPDLRAVVAGDFNAEDHETPLKLLVGAEEDTGNGKLSERSLVVLDRALSEDRRFSVLHHGRPQMLDHILITRPLLSRFRSIEVHNETLADEAMAYGKTRHLTASYHAPVVAEFSD